MKKEVKILLGVLVLSAAMLNLEGCEDRKEKCEKQAINMLEERYHEKFEIENYLGHEWKENYYELLVCPQEQPNILFEAKVACDGSYLADGYVSARVCEKIERNVEENLKDLNGYLLVKAVPLVRVVKCNNPYMGIDEFIEAVPGNVFVIYLYLVPSNENALHMWETIQLAFDGMKNLDGTLQLHLLDEMTLKRIQSYFAENAEFYYEYDQIVEGVYSFPVRFEKGILQGTKEEFMKAVGDKL